MSRDARLLALFAVMAIVVGVSTVDAGETLYNGIVLGSPWPPKMEQVTREPMSPPYLAAPPAVIPIDVGRQLFVDDFLIEKTDLKRTFHLAELHPKNPILKPDKPWETATQRDPTAMVFSDGVWFDPQDKLFKMWYMGGYVRGTCYAFSKDGITWEKPGLPKAPNLREVESNVVQLGWRDSATAWLDLEEKDPAKRFKFFVVESHEKEWKLALHFCGDGVTWGERVAWSTPVGDRTTVFYNPFRRVWVYSIRANFPGMGRSRRYREHPDALAGATWTPEEAVPWVGADREDPPRADLRIPPQLYNLDAVAYESLLLGLFTIWPGQPTARAKPNYVCLGFSRDGFHWCRPDHRPFLGVSERYGDWNWGNVQSAGGGCLVVGDRLYFYFSARGGIQGSQASGVCTTGLATLRRDGFASMDAGEAEGTLTTRPIRFSGKHLFVNAAIGGRDEGRGTGDAKEGPEAGAQKGEGKAAGKESAGLLAVEVLGADGQPIAPFTRANCSVASSTRDSTLLPIAWQGAADLSTLAGKPVRLRFHLRNARLYAFWVSPEASGASHGYVAAGGPAFTAPTDTVGSAAIHAR